VENRGSGGGAPWSEGQQQGLSLIHYSAKFLKLQVYNNSVMKCHFYTILLSSVKPIIPPAGVCPMKVFEIEFGLLKVVISHFDAFWPCWPFPPLKIRDFKNPRWRRAPSWKIEKSPHLSNGLPDRHEMWRGDGYWHVAANLLFRQLKIWLYKNPYIISPLIRL